MFLQPLRLDIKRRLTARSDRVKCCDLHPTESWMLASLYNGNVHVWNYESQTLVKSFEVREKGGRSENRVGSFKENIKCSRTGAIVLRQHFLLRKQKYMVMLLSHL